MLAQPANAQGATVTAQDPEGMVALLSLAGYEPELSTDEVGDPRIDLTIAGYGAAVFFYGCDEQTHAGCDSVQFQTAFDRREPWSAAEVATISSRLRFVSVWLDEEGDPFVAWDLFTGDGIPSRAFLQTVTNFGDSLEAVAGLVYPDDGSQNADVDKAAD